MKHLNPKIRVPIEKNNQSIYRDETKCIKCGNCSKVCENFCSVLDYNRSEKSRAICVNCGQCLMTCPVDSIRQKSYLDEVKGKIKEGKVVIVSTSPAVRVSLGEEFGLEAGTMIEGKMVGLLSRLGFSYVLDTNFGADVTIMEEANELKERINNGGTMFSSCCPAWVKFAEIFYPDTLSKLSSCRSPIGMQGALIKTYFAKLKNLDPKDIVNVCLTPCVAKIMEINRPEQNKSGLINNSSMRDMDYCLTVRDIAKWAKDENIDFTSIKSGKFDLGMSKSSKVGAMFGRSGGVMESVIYSLLEDDSKNNRKIKFITESNPAIKTAKFVYNGKSIKTASVFGLKNVRELLNKIDMGEKYDFVEVMACPGGCIGGGGQPKTSSYEPKANEYRQNGINTKGSNTKIELPSSNPEIKALYKDYLGSQGSHMSKTLLHTQYMDRSSILRKNKKSLSLYKCEICGNVFENELNGAPSCPNCGQNGKNITALD